MPDEKQPKTQAVWVQPEDKATFDELCQRDGYSAPQWVLFRKMLQVFLTTMRERNVEIESNGNQPNG